MRLWQKKKKEDEEKIVHDVMENNEGLAMEDVAALHGNQGVAELEWIPWLFFLNNLQLN